MSRLVAVPRILALPMSKTKRNDARRVPVTLPNLIATSSVHNTNVWNRVICCNNITFPNCTIPSRHDIAYLGAFGLGVSLYFSTLVFFIVLAAILSVVNIPNFIYFSSDDYSPGQDASNIDDETRTRVWWSAMCTSTEWVPCADCHAVADKFPKRLATGTDPVTGQEVLLALHNSCNFEDIYTKGMLNYASLIIVIVGMMVIYVLNQQMETAFDEFDQTAADYSVVITDPPASAYEPKAWRQFFMDNKQLFKKRDKSVCEDLHVSVVTTALKNDELVQKLIKRRELLFKLKQDLKAGSTLDPENLQEYATRLRLGRKAIGMIVSLVFPGFPELLDEIEKLNNDILQLSKRKYPVSKVFVSFEKEINKRAVCTAFHTCNPQDFNMDAFNDEVISEWGKTNKFQVDEPEEPRSIKWEVQNRRPVLRDLTELAGLIVSLIVSFLVVIIIRSSDNMAPYYTSFLISGFNSAFPTFAKILTDTLEIHRSEGGRQLSLFVKISIFRWIITAAS